jgi:hypothetical protein
MLAGKTASGRLSCDLLTPFTPTPTPSPSRYALTHHSDKVTYGSFGNRFRSTMYRSILFMILVIIRTESIDSSTV